MLITPRVGFLAAKVIAPTRTSQSVYMEKKAIRDDFDAELQKQKTKIVMEMPPDERGARIIAGEVANTDIVKTTQPPPLKTPTLAETLRQSVVDVLLLCLFAVVLTTAAFLKFFRSDI